jgi:hypothetical protein
MSSYSGSLPGMRILWKGPSTPTADQRAEAISKAKEPGIQQVGNGVEKEYGPAREQYLRVYKLGVVPVWFSWKDK